MGKQSLSETQLQSKVAGIHLSGANSPKTSVVIMTGGVREGNLKMLHVFDKIGSSNQVFADERLFDILRLTEPRSIMVDCPLTEPPCVTCTRSFCPGVSACDDVAVSYMQALVEAQEPRKPRRRPLNPQILRLWDVRKLLQGEFSPCEPTYSANMAPLAVRAKTLQRRLNSSSDTPKLRETSVPLSLKIITEVLGLSQRHAEKYRSFEQGGEIRSEILERMVRRRWIRLNEIDRIEGSIENFQALMAAFVASLHSSAGCVMPDNDFWAGQGWVYLPDKKFLNP